MQKQSLIQIKVDEKTKKDFKQITEEWGLDPTNSLRVIIKKVCKGMISPVGDNLTSHTHPSTWEREAIDKYEEYLNSKQFEIDKQKPEVVLSNDDEIQKFFTS